MTQVIDESDQETAGFRIVSSMYPDNQFIKVQELDLENWYTDKINNAVWIATEECTGAYITVEDAEALVVTLQFIIKIIKDRQGNK